MGINRISIDQKKDEFIETEIRYFNRLLNDEYEKMIKKIAEKLQLSRATVRAMLEEKMKL